MSRYKCGHCGKSGSRHEFHRLQGIAEENNPLRCEACYQEYRRIKHKASAEQNKAKISERCLKRYKERRIEYLESLPETTCKGCGIKFKPTFKGVQHCSRDCLKKHEVKKYVPRTEAQKESARRRDKVRRDAKRELNPIINKVCLNCGNEFSPTDTRQVYCTIECRNSFNAMKQAKREVAKPKVINIGNCEACGKRYNKKQPHQKYCSQTCRNKADSEKERIARDKYRQENPLTCSICGTKFVITDGKQKFCSKKCQQRFNNIGKKTNPIHKDRRMKRMFENGKVDMTITLFDLSKRFNDRCAICHNTVDWSDFEARNGIFIAGETYPSIDHIIAVSNGGTHTWNNVQLAHRKCNTAKGAKEVYATSTGQLKLSV